MSVSKEQKKRLTLLQAYKRLFSSDEGQMVLKDLVSTHGMLSTSFKSDVNDMIFREGERNVILRILDKISYKEEQLMKLIKQIEGEENV